MLMSEMSDLGYLRKPQTRVQITDSKHLPESSFGVLYSISCRADLKVPKCLAFQLTRKL